MQQIQILLRSKVGTRFFVGGAHYSTYKQHLQSLLPPKPYRPLPDLTLHDKQFMYNPYEGDLLKLLLTYFQGRKLVSSYDWPPSLVSFVPPAPIIAFGNRSRYHGLWPNGARVLPTQLIPSHYWDLYADFDYVYDHYKEEVDTYWRCLYGGSNKEWVISEWMKHGLPFGYRADMYLHHGLAMASMIPQSFGYSLGVSLTRGDIISRSYDLMNELTLFGENIANFGTGPNGYPQYIVCPNPFSPSNNTTHVNSSYVVRNVRLELMIELVNGKAKYTAVGVPELDILKMHPGYADVIEPSSTFSFEKYGGGV